MTKVRDFASERRFLDRVASELHNSRIAHDYDGITEAVDDLEVIQMHTDFPVIRSRATKLISQAYDPLPKRYHPNA
ncbi:hypothetical protein [Aureimonas sp. D3]|uniref:hypothetical protein n=1 Tax=Aureimonas sp. D3 TaxID=1638164 RepID=UPI0007824EBE|nr:hypothetical protein [Aureimonas sp. D3]